VIDWVMKAEGLSFRHAVERLPTHLSPLAAASGSPTRASVRSDADDQTLLQQVIAYYHDTLKQSPEALAYLESRGLGSAEMIEHFHLGFAKQK